MLFFGASFLCGLQGQTVMKNSVISQGATAASGSGIFISATLGQTAIGIVSGVTTPQTIDNQGFWYSATTNNITEVVEHRVGVSNSNLLSLRNYPNPAIISTNFEFNVPANNQEVTLQIYNSLGSLEKTVLSGLRESGLIKINITTNEFESGSYTAVLRVGAKWERIVFNVIK